MPKEELLKALNARLQIFLEYFVTRWRNWTAPYRLAWFKSPRHEAFFDWYLIQINRCLGVVIGQIDSGHLRRATYLLRGVYGFSRIIEHLFRLLSPMVPPLTPRHLKMLRRIKEGTPCIITANI